MPEPTVAYFREGAMKLPRRTISASGRRRRRAAGRVQHRAGANYPSRPVRIIVGVAAGGGTDIVGRLIGQWLSERLGQQFVIENRPGAGTTIGTEVVVRAPADGYTLLILTVAHSINKSVYDKLSFDFTARHRAGRGTLSRAIPVRGYVFSH